MRMGMGLGLGLGSMGGGGGSSDMILVYAIPAPSTNIQLAIQANSTWFSAGQSVVIDWGDDSDYETVSASTEQSGYIGHTYTSVGTYTIKISGSMTMYGRSTSVYIAGQELLTRIDSFGKMGITSLALAFYYCTRLVSVPKTLPSSILNISQAFRSCNNAAFNPDVSKWDVSSVSNMYGMFYNSNGVTFNPDFSNWDVSGVSDIGFMFYNCSGGMEK